MNVSGVAVWKMRSGADSRSRPPTIIALTGLLGFLVIGAIQGGIAMITDPIEPLGMSVEYLEGTPVDSYFWPGMFFIGIAAASLVTSIGLMSGWRWHWASKIESAVGYRWPWLGALATGLVLAVFEIIELFFVPFHPVMHPLLIAGSAAIIALPLTRSARSHLAARASGNV